MTLLIIILIILLLGGSGLLAFVVKSALFPALLLIQAAPALGYLVFGSARRA